MTNRYASLCRGCKILVNFQVARDQRRAVFLLLLFRPTRDVHRVKRGVRRRQDKATGWLQQLGQRQQQRRDLGHVHQRHLANRGVEGALAQGEQRGLVRAVEHAVIDLLAVGIVARSFDHRWGKVKGRDLCPERGQPPGVEAVAAGRVEHALAGLQIEQPLRGGPNQRVDKVVALVAHVLVPVGGVGVPGGAGFGVGRGWFRSCSIPPER